MGWGNYTLLTHNWIQKRMRESISGLLLSYAEMVKSCLFFGLDGKFPYINRLIRWGILKKMSEIETFFGSGRVLTPEKVPYKVEEYFFTLAVDKWSFSLATTWEMFAHFLRLRLTNGCSRWLPLREQKNFFSKMVNFLSFSLATTWGTMKINGGDAYALLMTCRRSLNGGDNKKTI